MCDISITIDVLREIAGSIKGLQFADEAVAEVLFKLQRHDRMDKVLAAENVRNYLRGWIYKEDITIRRREGRRPEIATDPKTLQEKQSIDPGLAEVDNRDLLKWLLDEHLKPQLMRWTPLVGRPIGLNKRELQAARGTLPRSRAAAFVV